MHVNETGTGNATMLGKYDFSYQITVDLLTGDGSGGLIDFVAANGDHLYAEGNAYGGPSSIPNFNEVTENYVITGGTGRFIDASGSFTIKRLVSNITGMSSGTFEGTILALH